MKNYMISQNNIEKHIIDKETEILIEKLNEENPFDLEFGVLKYSDSLKKKLMKITDFKSEKEDAFGSWSKISEGIVGLNKQTREIVVVSILTRDYFALTRYYGSKPNELFEETFLDGYLSAKGFADLTMISTSIPNRGKGIGLWLLNKLNENIHSLTLVPINPKVEDYCITQNMSTIPLKKTNHPSGPKRPMYTNNIKEVNRFINAPTKSQTEVTMFNVMGIEHATTTRKNTFPLAIKTFKPLEPLKFKGTKQEFELTALLGIIEIEKNKEPQVSFQVENHEYQYPLTNFIDNHLESATGVFRFDEGMFEKHNIYNLINPNLYNFKRRINLNNFETAYRRYTFK